MPSVGDSPELSSTFVRQVTIEYANKAGAMIPLRVHSVVVSTQHAPEIPIEDLRREIMQKVRLAGHCHTPSWGWRIDAVGFGPMFQWVVLKLEYTYM